jgi:high-affinity Fe2+/Pb2+ permease
MATAAKEKHPDERPTGSKLWRAPFVGIAVVVIMLLGIGLAHALMRAIEESLGRDNTYIASVIMGLAAIIALWYGVKSKSENFAT